MKPRFSAQAKEPIVLKMIVDYAYFQELKKSEQELQQIRACRSHPCCLNSQITSAKIELLKISTFVLSALAFMLFFLCFYLAMRN